jgi:hypothetical protein
MVLTAESMECKYSTLLPSMLDRKMDMDTSKYTLEPAEQTSIESWVNGIPGMSSDSKKAQLSSIRIREIQLQVVLLLKLIAESKDRQEGSLGVSAYENRLDVLVDVLCILQISDSVLGSLSSRSGEDDQEESSLSQFCTEIIMPYFARSVPELSNRLFTRCGVPIPPLMDGGNESGSRLLQQDTVTNSDSAVKRVLNRSFSDHEVIKARRASSSRKLEHLLRNDPLRKPTSRTSSTKETFERFGNRQVDLGSSSSSSALSSRSLSMQLSSAIDGLRKPNPRLIGAEIADDADNRRAMVGRRPKSMDLFC